MQLLLNIHVIKQKEARKSVYKLPILKRSQSVKNKDLVLDLGFLIYVTRQKFYNFVDLTYISFF